MQSSFRDVRSLAAVAICLALAAPAAAAPLRSIAEARMGGGALDRLLPVANQRYLAAALPNARLRVYPDAAHGFIVQHQRDLTPVVDRFLRAMAPRPRTRSR
jgi:pimeloyl-ACP methyl ester carboxylesterase